MNEIKLVHGAAGNRTFATPAKQAELKQSIEQRKQERTDRLVNEWFTVDESAEPTFLDVLMTIGMFVVVPFLVVVTALGAILI